MRSDLSIDERAALSRALGHLEDESPVAPDLPSVQLAATKGRRWSASAVAAGAFLLAVAMVAPAAWLLRSSGDAASESTEAPTATVVGETEAPPTSAPTVTSTAPSTTLAPMVPETVAIEPVSVPISGTESLELAANDHGLFAAASVPNPDYWDERVWRSVDGGASWQEVLSVAGEGVVVDLAASGDEVAALISGHVVAGPAYLYRSIDGGVTWSQIELPAPDGAVGLSATRVAIGDTTVVTGQSWDGVLEESFNDGAVLSSTQIGVRSLAWKLQGDTVGAPVDVAPGGAVLDLAWTGDTFIAVGLAEIDSDDPAIWTSADGIGWHLNPIPELPTGIASDGFESVVVSGNGAIIAMTDVIPADDNDAIGTIVYARNDAGEWTVVQFDEYGFVSAVGTEWGFVTTARLKNGSDQFVVASSVDGIGWVTTSQTDVYITSGTAPAAGAFASGYSFDSGEVGIWRLTTP